MRERIRAVEMGDEVGQAGRRWLASFVRRSGDGGTGGWVAGGWAGTVRSVDLTGDLAVAWRPAPAPRIALTVFSVYGTP
jgi:hypothetical protein